jgi:integrase
MKLAEYLPLYFELRAIPDNRAAVVYKKRLDAARELLPVLGDRELEQITPLDVRRLIAGWAARKLSPKTQNNYLSLLRNILRAAVLDQVALTACQVESRKQPQRTLPRVLTFDDIGRLLAVVDREPEHWRFAFRFALLTGLRVGELRALARADLCDRGEGMMLYVTKSTSGRFSTVGQTKGRPRILPVGERLISLVEKFHRGSKLMFADSPRATEPLTYKAFDFRMRKVRATLRMPWLHWHTMRHSFATQLRTSGVPLTHIQALLGHVDFRTTLLYAQSVPRELYAAIGALDTWFPN